MTTQIDPKNSTSQVTPPNKSASNKLRGVSTLRRRLLISILPAILVPFVAASIIGYKISERQAKNRVIEKLEDNAIIASTTISKFIRNSFETVNLIAVNPEAIQALKTANGLAQEQNLPQQPIIELENQFAATKSLNVNKNLNNYLQQIVQSGQFVEIFFTDANGFNVALSNLTSDFVQSDEAWWQIAQREGLVMDEPEFDRSANSNVIPFSQSVRDPQTGEFLGVIKAVVPITSLSSDLSSQLNKENSLSSFLQIVDPDESFVLHSSEETETYNLEDTDDDEEEGIAALEDADDDDDDDEEDESVAALEDAEDDDDDDDEEIDLERVKVVGGEPIVEVIETLVIVEGNTLSFEALEEAERSEIEFLSVEEALESIARRPGFSEVRLRQEKILNETSTIVSFRYQDNLYTLSTVPNTDFVSIDVIDYDVVASAARDLLIAFNIIAVILGSISLGLIILLSRQFTKPLINLSAITQQAAEGNLDVEASLEGTLETRTLANNFNNLVKQVQDSLKQQQALTEEQRQERERLEREIFQLLDEISDATEGDLTVRASLSSMEMSTVADLFNAVIDSLQEIAVEAKQSTSQVGSSLKENEEEIRKLAERAITEAKETRDTLISIEQMSQSIREVAANASQAALLADDTNNTVLESSNAMDLTVDSILNLRTTVGDTAKKMKRLGESSQKISQAVSLIEEIALRTNLLAINASVEASRAGEQGQGFTVVAEQVAALAEQSAAATKEIAQIVAAIQVETQELTEAMETGTTQVVDTTRMVESTKQSLGVVLNKSQEINQLMRSIAQATESQTDTSQSVTKLMQQIAQLSEASSLSSKQVAESMVATAEVAQKLESSVAKFKVAEST